MVLLRFSIVCLGLLASCLATARASLKKMAVELVENNATLATSKAQIALGQYDHLTLLLSKSWNFNYRLGSLNTQLANFSGAGNPSPFDEVVHSLNISRDFSFGGNLSLGNTLARRETIDRGTRYRFWQELGYRQNLGRNFFGFEYRKDVERSQLNNRLNELSHDEELHGKLLELAQAYIESGQHLALLELQGEARRRAERRLEVTRRRVRDGLRMAVDLYQTRAALHRQEELVQSAQLRLQSALENIGRLLHRQVAQSEVANLRQNTFQQRQAPGGESAANRSLKRLEQQQRLFQSALEKSRFFLTPRVELSTFYRTSQVGGVRSGTLSGGSLGGEHKEVAVALDLSWKWGRPFTNTERLKARLNFETARHNLQKSRTDAAQSVEVLKGHVALLQRNIASARERLELSLKALREYNQLYDRGRANLDQVIRAEEAFIETEISYVNYVAEREISVYRLSHLYGQLPTFIQEAPAQ